MFVRVEISAPGVDATKSKADGPLITLGRDPACPLTFDGQIYSAVSWQHARIELSPQGSTVTDLGSSNGTFVNGGQVIGKKSIQTGDVIGLGQTGPKVRIVEIGGANLPPALPTKAEKMLPQGMLTPPVSSKPISFSSDSLRPVPRRRRSPLPGIVLGFLAVGAVAAAGYIVFTSQQVTGEKKDDKKDTLVAVAPVKKDDPVALQPVEPPKKDDVPAPPEPPKTDPPKDPTKVEVALIPKTGKETKVEPAPLAPPGPAEGHVIYRRTLQSTGWVTVHANPPFMVTGTGALIDKENRLFLTAYHVIDGAREAKIYFPTFDDEKRPISERGHYLKKETPVIGDVIVGDPKRDLAILRLRSIPEGVLQLPIAAKGVEVAHRIYTVGNPGVSSALWTYTEGSVRQVVFKKFRMDNRQDVEAWMVEAQFPINQGDSGGPVVNDRIELVGVNCSLNSKAQLMSNCVDLREINVVLERARRDTSKPPPSPPASRLD